MKLLVSIAGIAVLSLLVGCGPSGDQNTGASSGPDNASSERTVSSDDTNRARDNTGVNERDRNDATLTPMDQGSSAADRELTANIRKAVTQDQFSTDAKNIKIMTVNGKVTLRGPVKDAQEKQAVETAAKAVTGVSEIDNQLEPKQ